MGKTIQLNGFPSSVTVDEVKVFVERHTGAGTVYAIKVRQNKNGGKRAYAIIQFTTTREAEYIISLANQSLWYGRSYLKAWQAKLDIVPKPRTFLHSIENITMHFGCQTSKEKFLILWKAENVSVNFGTGMRKLHFSLSDNYVAYRLELSYENVWQIELHRPRGETAKYLLIQLLGAPRIYEKESRSSGHVSEDLFLNFFKDIPDDQWVRQLILLHHAVLGSLLLYVWGFLMHGYLAGPTLDNSFYRLVDPRKVDAAHIEHALEKLYHLKECCYEPSRWLQEQYIKYRTSRHPPKPPAISLDSGLVYVHRVQITPSKVYFCGPEINVSNRVLRHFSQYIDNFLRVSFVDEELDKMFSTDLSPRTSSVNEDRRTAIYKRILSILRNGIVIAGKKFETLAFSSSQLRDNSIWMFASRDGHTAADIREWMGNFDSIKNVAKYAARLGQSFGSSTETLSVDEDDRESIPDIEVERGGVKYVFSDGIGKISAKFARKVALKCGCKGTSPSAFQIRYGGYKGVVAVDPTSSKKLSLRKSMSKYESTNIKLDVLAFSKFQPCYLNRQLISLLSTLGVKDHFFENKQRQAVEQLDAILTDPLKAQEALDMMSPGENTNILKEMLMCGYKPDAEPFLSMMLQTFRASKTLEYGQVFVQFSGTRHKEFYNDSITFSGTGSDQRFVVEGNVVVAKNPCLHPGDVRVLRAVDVPALHHLVDCVVFPQKDLVCSFVRPHPNECSGSDLDGDIYFVCWDPELIPPRQVQPMDYTPAETIQLDHVVTIEEVEEYFVNYIVNDSLGIIANAHTVHADREPSKAMSGPCIELAKLFSIAVDFPKTGVPAVIPQSLHVKEYPDFMEKPDKPTYESPNVIGMLFREVKDIAPNSNSSMSFTKEKARRSYDPDMEVDGFEDFTDDAFYYKGNYDYKLGNLMDYYGVKTEAEILSGNIMRMAKSFTKRRDAEAITVAVRSLRKEARAWFNEKGSGSDSGADDVYAKASAWYYVTYHHSYWGCYNEGMNRDHFLSFPWCVYDKLVQIKKDKASLKRALHLSSLEHHFRHGLHLS
ncbi:hypothetical protein SLA2020_346100 [Shorea laevis]